MLDGQAQILNYKRLPNVWYYREVIPGEKRYRTQKIHGAESEAEAAAQALDIYGEFRKATPPPPIKKERPKVLQDPLPPHRSADAAELDVETGGQNRIARTHHYSQRKNSGVPVYSGRKKKGIPVNDAIDDFLTVQMERVEAGLLLETSVKEYLQVLGVHLKNYFNEEGVTHTGQIKDDTFERYPHFRKWCTKLTRNKEAGLIKAFVDKHLIKKRLISPEVAMLKDLVPKVKIKQQDLDANPAINKKDWETINKWIRLVYVKQGQKHPRPSVGYWRYLFWHFTLIMKNTGARPNELLNLRWRDVVIEDVGRISQTKMMEEIQELEMEGIEVIPDDFDKETVPGEWADNPNHLGREERLVAYVMVKTSKTGDQREIPSNLGSVFKRFKEYQMDYIEKWGMDVQITPNTLIFGNPHNGYEPYKYATFTSSWWRMLKGIEGQLAGHKFSDRNYTIYSMRSTYIENQLLAGMDIFLLSRICGHSVQMLTKHYERIDVKERAQEITNINYAKKAKQSLTVDLFAD